MGKLVPSPTKEEDKTDKKMQFKLERIEQPPYYIPKYASSITVAASGLSTNKAERFQFSPAHHNKILTLERAPLTKSRVKPHQRTFPLDEVFLSSISSRLRTFGKSDMSKSSHGRNLLTPC